MPIFEFKCLKCGEEFEVLLKSKEEIVSVKCKLCGSPQVERLMSVVNSIIGSGETKASEKPRVAESHSCPTGTCTHLELPGHQR